MHTFNDFLLTEFLVIWNDLTLMWRHCNGEYTLSVTRMDPFHRSHNVSDKYPTMHHFLTEICTCVHISVTKWFIVEYVTSGLWDLWDGSLAVIFADGCRRDPNDDQICLPLLHNPINVTKRGGPTRTYRISSRRYCVWAFDRPSFNIILKWKLMRSSGPGE